MDTDTRDIIIWRFRNSFSMFIFDLIVPYDFNKELKEKNVAAGFLIAGIFISIAIIIRTVII